MGVVTDPRPDKSHRGGPHSVISKYRGRWTHPPAALGKAGAGVPHFAFPAFPSANPEHAAAVWRGSALPAHQRPAQARSRVRLDQDQFRCPVGCPDMKWPSSNAVSGPS